MMEGGATHQAYARSLLELREALKHVPQKRACVVCDNSAKLECPKCPDGEVCQFTIPTDCTQCPRSVCMADDSPSASSGAAAPSASGNGDSGPSAGPIAGGVIGGIAVIAVITYLVWRFLIKPKRSRIPESELEPAGNDTGDVEKDNGSRITHRSSTHTVHSIASTVLTRASNIIQIAYIPGVTNRANQGPGSPTVLVPPVPPIPMHHTEAHRQATDQQDDQHFFVPGNLRDSTYSGISTYSEITSYAPRSSIASTIYGKQAQVQNAAQTGMRAKPTVVSVRSGSVGGNNTPPMPDIDYERFGGRPESSASFFSVGSAFVNNANTATQGRAQVVKLGGGQRSVDDGLSSPQSSAWPAPLGTVSPPAPTHDPTRGGPGMYGSAGMYDSPVTYDAPHMFDSSRRDLGPFSDPPGGAGTPGRSRLGSVMEDASEGPYQNGGRGAGRPSSRERDSSPFGDEYAMRQ
ncbi:hypothetical protein RJ55_03540 [Drechmeria coniospora]|nr:hypothetical protein RJ55_03540 [Drechmeria coniospora]